jgi:heme/copper-type cytochrome/quinol oxidase subunit 2
MDDILTPLITLKITGFQWYWNYSIKDIDGIEINIDSYMLSENDIKNGQLRLLNVDNEIYMPILTPIRLLVTSEDVIHSWSIPSTGIKVDAIPGRINQSYLYLLKEGTYFGQCFELCGLNHAYMPIVLKGVKLLDYYNWLLSFKNINLHTYSQLLSILSLY